MIKLGDYRTESAFPAEMKTVERTALAYAFDRQKQRFLKRLDRVCIWADLDKVDEGILDVLAVESRVLFYDAGLSVEIKRELIRNAVRWYMKLGTLHAMNEMVDILFGEGAASASEWFEYGGHPHHFRLVIDISKSRIDVDVLKTVDIIKTYKRLTARLDGIAYKFKKRAETKVVSYVKMNKQMKILAYRP